MRFFAGYLASRVSNDCKVYPFTRVGSWRRRRRRPTMREVSFVHKRGRRGRVTRQRGVYGEKGEKARREKSGTCIFTGTRDSATARRWSGTRNKDNCPESKYECENKNWITARKLQFFDPVKESKFNSDLTIPLYVFIFISFLEKNRERRGK